MSFHGPRIGHGVAPESAPGLPPSSLIVLNADTTAFEAALAMRTNEVGAIVVTEDDAIAGIVTDRHLALRVVGEDRPARTTSLGDVMSRDVATLPPEAAMREVIGLMR